MPLDAPGVWVAYHADWSGMFTFATEVEALRHACNNCMQVAFVAHGSNLRDAQ